MTGHDGANSLEFMFVHSIAYDFLGALKLGLVDKHIMIVLHLYSRYLRKYRKLEPVN